MELRQNGRHEASGFSLLFCYLLLNAVPTHCILPDGILLDGKPPAAASAVRHHPAGSVRACSDESAVVRSNLKGAYAQGFCWLVCCFRCSVDHLRRVSRSRLVSIRLRSLVDDLSTKCGLLKDATVHQMGPVVLLRVLPSMEDDQSLRDARHEARSRLRANCACSQGP